VRRQNHPGRPDYRDFELPAKDDHSAPGKQYVVTIGIDHYKSAPRLHNAVGDAVGVCRAFERLGFVPFQGPILDGEATGARLNRLVENDLLALGTNDSLVVFFAGHGHIRRTPQANGSPARTAYLLPVDATHTKDGVEGGLCADPWLAAIARLSPRHIFVVLDACHSGMTLDHLMRYRASEPQLPAPMEILRKRRSRRVITSALDDQLALDNGPIEGHSLFTGCLIQALDGGVFAREGRLVATTSEICALVRSRVIEFPNSKQTPDCGALDLHEHGELIVEHRPPAPTRVSGPHQIQSRSLETAQLQATPQRGAEGLRSKAAPVPPTPPPGDKRR
jgi:hypothetical protein